MDNLLSTLAMLCIFHLIGGAAMGGAVRGWLGGRFSFGSLKTILWGGVFGIVPLFMGYNLFVPSAPALLGVEVAVLVAAFLVVALVPQGFLDSFDGKVIAPIAFGGLFMLIGLAVGVMAFAEEPVMGVLLGGLFAIAGGAVFIWGMIRAFKA